MTFLLIALYIYIYIYICIIKSRYCTDFSLSLSLSLSRHLSLSSITPVRSSRLYPVSVQNCCRQVLVDWPTLACPCEGFQWRSSLMCSSLLLRQCPACPVRLIWMVLEIGDKWPYSCCFAGCCFQDLKQDGNYTRMLRAVLKKSWKQHPNMNIYPTPKYEQGLTQGNRFEYKVFFVLKVFAIPRLKSPSNLLLPIARGRRHWCIPYSQVLRVCEIQKP